MTTLKSVVAVSAGLIGSAHAFWRMECPGRVGVGRLDPIVDPGTISKHVHYVHGSGAFSSTADTPDLIGSDCTSCRVTEDKSAYWHPSLYFKDASTGEFELVEEKGGMLAYYLLYGDEITAFPPGFRMLSGSTERREYTAGNPSEPDPAKSLWAAMKETDQDILAQRALGFNCLNYAKTPAEGTLYRHYMPDKDYIDANCLDGIRLEIMFPSCWKGPGHLDSDNHKDHVAFPDLVMTGTCPDDYPYRLPSLMYETIVDTTAFSDRSGQFVFANNDTTGYGYHADFITGWEEDFLQSAIETCTSDTGMIEDCPLFTVVDEATAEECKWTTPKLLGGEDVFGPLKSLPGMLDSIIGDDSGEDNVVSSAAPVPTLTYAPGTYPSDPASPLPGQIFKETSVAIDQASSLIPSVSVPAATDVAAADVGALAETAAAPATTAAPELEPVDDAAASFYSTQYITKGNLISKILWEEEVVYVTEKNDVTTTVTITSAAPADVPARRRRRSHIHGHGHGRHI